MKKTIAVLPGDGIGPEIVDAAAKVLAAVAGKFGHTFEMRSHLVGGAAIDATGAALPPETLAACMAADAVLLGAVGGPKWDALPSDRRPERAALLPLQRAADGKSARDVMDYSIEEIARIARTAFEAARKRRGKVTSVDKANVLETSKLWRETVTSLHAAEYADVELEHMYVDNAAMQLVRAPRRFDVILTENMFGDILSDEASQVTGSIGMLPSASLRADGFGLYEPIHGSAPDIADKDLANPLATILSAAMMLRHSFGLVAEAAAIEDAVRDVLAAGVRTGDIARHGAPAVGTRAMGEAVCAALKQ